MMSSPIFMKFKHKSTKGIYLSDISNFILIEHKRTEIHSREVNSELWRKRSYCDLDLWPKVTNFHRVRASAISNHLAKTASKSVHPFGWNFVHKKTSDTRHLTYHLGVLTCHAKSRLWTHLRTSRGKPDIMILIHIQSAVFFISKVRWYWIPPPEVYKGFLATTVDSHFV